MTRYNATLKNNRLYRKIDLCVLQSLMIAPTASTNGNSCSFSWVHVLRLYFSHFSYSSMQPNHLFSTVQSLTDAHQESRWVCDIIKISLTFV